MIGTESNVLLMTDAFIPMRLNGTTSGMKMFFDLDGTVKNLPDMDRARGFEC
jgi:hypothetical protein